jgi:hypothetical protein
MKQEHLTPDGWKPCTATTKDCKYEERRIANASAFIDSAVEDVKAGKPNAIKGFFNTLFGSPKKSSSPSIPSVTSVAPIAPSPVLTLPANVNKVVQGQNGQYEVTCKDPWEDRMLVHKFGDLITDKTLAERLHKADPRKEYQLGECGVIAGELWNRSEHVKEYYILKTDTEPQFGTHHFVQLKDGTYADSLGIWTEEAFLSYWRDVDPSVEISTFDVEDEPESRNPNFPISNPELFNVVNELIEQHMKG